MLPWEYCVYLKNNSDVYCILFRCAQPNRKPFQYDTSRITGAEQTCLFIVTITLCAKYKITQLFVFAQNWDMYTSYMVKCRIRKTSVKNSRRGRRKHWKPLETHSPNQCKFTLNYYMLLASVVRKRKLKNRKRGKFYPEQSSATWEWFIYIESDNCKHSNTTCPHGKNMLIVYCSWNRFMQT